MAFQTYDTAFNKHHTADYFARMRVLMQQHGVAAFVLPRTDPWQNEYLPLPYQRVARLTAFDGSAGILILTQDNAYLLVDGRYTLQAPQQIDTACICVVPYGDKTLAQHCLDLLPENIAVGYDAELFSIKQLAALHKNAASFNWIALSHNICDDVLPPLPPSPRVPAWRMPSDVCSADKIAPIIDTIKQHNADALLITDATSIAWLLNVRGGDVPHLPVVLSSLLLYADGRALWLADAAQIPFEPDVPLTIDEAQFWQSLPSGALCLLDEHQVNSHIAARLTQQGVRLQHLDDVCALPRACKTDAEIANMQQAHVRDGVALCKLLYWLSTQDPSTLCEISIAQKTEELRALSPQLIDLSFDTICGADANGAIVHYRVTTETNRRLHAHSLLLLDSGGQYTDGTTDVTRTIAFGTPAAHIKQHYTLVLKGHLALTHIRWPARNHITGAHLDVLARAALWQHGLDYDHGTGHGVGMCLSVHEGTVSISLRAKTVLQPNMVVSNEPGFYVAEQYGIRIENLQYVTRVSDDFLGFTPLTLVPYDRKLIDDTLLSTAEHAQIAAYHDRVYQCIAPHLTAAEAAFLQTLCY